MAYTKDCYTISWGIDKHRGVGMKQSLNDAIIKNAKPSDKTVTLKDGGGLFLYVEPNGSKRWRFRYRFNDKRVGCVNVFLTHHSTQSADVVNWWVGKSPTHPTQL